MENSNNLSTVHIVPGSQPSQQTIIVNTERNSNSYGTAGFVLSLVSILLSWLPALNFIIWFLGALFSLIGVFRRPRGLAIAGLIISFIGVIVLIVLLGLMSSFM